MKKNSMNEAKKIEMVMKSSGLVKDIGLNEVDAILDDRKNDLIDGINLVIGQLNYFVGKVKSARDVNQIHQLNRDITSYLTKVKNIV